MIALYPEIKRVHVTAVALSGGLFALRGAMTLARSRYANHAALRYLSYAIDTTLLAAALALAAMLGQYPFVQGWLTMKLALLTLYVVLGSLALKRGRTQGTRAFCYFAALATFLFIVSVAIAHDPRGIFARPS